MGLGDQLLGTGLARGAAAKGKRVAFGNGRKIIWDHNSESIFRNNPNIAPPGSERAKDLKWVPFYKGSRLYNRHDVPNSRWVWNYAFKSIPGEVYFDPAEVEWARQFGSGFVVIEPNIEGWKSCASNKDWGFQKYQRVCDWLCARGNRVVQFSYDRGGSILDGASPIRTPTFRHALAVMANAALYLGAEGGLHHGAAAVGIPGVVIFGGFVPPSVTGYDTHTNLTGVATACGSLSRCQHCIDAMDRISVEEVINAADARLKVAA